MKNMESVIFQVVRDWNTQDIIDLYRCAGWWKEEYDPDGIPPLIQGSYIFVVGIQEKTGKAVAMGRIISDTVHIGYIHDLCVLTGMRGKKIGTSLVQFLVNAGRNAGLSSLYLVAEPGTCTWYEKSGFMYMKNMIFLLQE